MNMNTNPETTPVTPIRISNPLDLVSIVPHIVGFVPTESVVLMTKTRSPMCARLDLRHASDASVMERVGSAMPEIGGEAVAVIYSHTPITDDLLTAMRSARSILHRFGWDLADLFQVGKDEVTSVDLDTGDRARLGETESLRHTAPAASMVVLGSAVQESRDKIGQVADLPEEAERVARDRQIRTLTEYVALFNTALTTQDMESVGLVVKAMEYSAALRDIIANVCMNKPDLAQEAAQRIDAATGTEVREAGLRGDQDAFLTRELAGFIGDMMTPRRPGEFELNAIATLTRGLGAVPRGQRSRGLSLAALLSWWDGQMVMAEALANRAINESSDPDEGDEDNPGVTTLAGLVLDAIAAGMTPGWTRNVK